MNNWNLSKTEFTAYLECPLKFFLIKQQNQHSEEGPRGRADISNYPPELLKGIEWHKRLHDFIREYKTEMMLNNVPPAIVYSHPNYQLFWDHEKHRLAVDADHWYPLALELYLQTTTMRGTIDRVDPIDEDSCCIVEYKSSPEKSGYMDEELLFYTLLAKQSKIFTQKINKIITRVGCYYYSTGDFISQEITPELLDDFTDFYSTIREQINQGIWYPKKDCSLMASDCGYAVVCTKIPEKHKRRGISE